MTRRPGRDDRSAKGPAWFAPKRYGYGAGLPTAWQGWALTIGYVAIILALVPLAVRSLVAYLSTTTTITILFLLIARKTTPGGWQWRWGRKGEKK